MHKHTDMAQSQSSADKLARGLGWLSLGVGLYQLLAPGRITRALTAVGILTAIDVACAKALSQRHVYQGGATPNYRYRSGFPQGLASARGTALGFQVPADMKDALPSPTL